jgi:hypothetical protein
MAEPGPMAGWSRSWKNVEKLGKFVTKKYGNTGNNHRIDMGNKEKPTRNHGSIEEEALYVYIYIDR